ncbi:MAG: hypothetical protein WC061_09305, partial [Melioribacteraceae bacterium]
MVNSFVKKNILFLSILLQVSWNQAQQIDKVVARAGDAIITKEEFYKRYEFTPRIKTETAFDQASFKKDLLLTMMGEKLLARAAREEKLESSRDYMIMMQYLRNIYLRDALYKIEIKDKIAVPDSELAKGRRRILKSFRTKFIFSTDEEEIRNIYSAIAGGASFDSLLDSRPEKYEQSGSEE